MDVVLEELLRPVSAEAPCGPDARELAAFAHLRALDDETDRAGSSGRVAWAREQDRILDLARQSRDLRVWVWLTRSWLAADGLAGFARGLELLAAGLERYWDTLPPYDPEDTSPRERFMARLATLTGLCGSSFQTTDRDLLARRSTTFFLEDLALAMPAGDAATVGRIEHALAAIAALFRDRFGAAHDPQLGFAEVSRRLAAVATRAQQDEPSDAGSAPARGNGAAMDAVGSRAEVVRALDLVLDYYTRHEPSSPVPLLVARAKRLVPMSFLDAIRDLAPGGLKELQAVTGEDAKQSK